MTLCHWTVQVLYNFKCRQPGCSVVFCCAFYWSCEQTWKILIASICYVFIFDSLVFHIFLSSSFFLIHQMSKSTGNFLTLSQAIGKFSADGTTTYFSDGSPPFHLPFTPLLFDFVFCTCVPLFSIHHFYTENNCNVLWQCTDYCSLSCRKHLLTPANDN